jgi:hypothetical protein
MTYTDEQLEQLERDAERYRWLRAINSWPSANDHARVVKFDRDGGIQFLTGEVLDRACDEGQAEAAAKAIARRTRATSAIAAKQMDIPTASELNGPKR